MKKTIQYIVAFVAALLCGGAWAASTPKMLLNVRSTSASAVAGWQDVSLDDGLVNVSITASESTGNIGFATSGTAGKMWASNPTTDFASGTYTDIFGKAHSTFAEEVNASLGLNSENAFSSSVYMVGSRNGAGGVSTRSCTLSGLTGGKYVIYVGIGNADGTNKFKIETSGYGSCEALEYVTSVAGDNATVVNQYTTFSAGTSIAAGSAGAMAIRMKGIVPKDDGTVAFTLDGGRCGFSFLAVAEIEEPTRMFRPILTSTEVSTGWKVSSIDELLTWNFSAEMIGASISSQPVMAKGCFPVKHTDGTVKVEFQTSNGETKAVSAIFSEENGVVKVKGKAACYFNAGNRVGESMFNADGSSRTDITANGTFVTSTTASGYGVQNIIATPNYYMSNGSASKAKANYSGKSYTLNLPAADGYPVGTKVMLKSMAIATEGNGNNLSAKLEINGVKSSSRTDPVADSALTDSGASSYLITYYFDDPVVLTIGTAATSFKFLTENDTDDTASQHRFALASRATASGGASTGMKFSVLSISGESNWTPITKVIAERVTPKQAKVSVGFNGNCWTASPVLPDGTTNRARGDTIDSGDNNTATDVASNFVAVRNSTTDKAVVISSSIRPVFKNDNSVFAGYVKKDASWTVSMVVKPTAITDKKVSLWGICAATWNGGKGIGLVADTNGNPELIQINGRSASTSIAAVSEGTGVLYDGSYHVVTVSYNVYAAKRFAVYVDGEKVAEGGTAQPEIGAQMFEVGSFYGGANEVPGVAIAAGACVDDIAAWGYAMSESEIQGVAAKFPVWPKARVNITISENKKWSEIEGADAIDADTPCVVTIATNAKLTLDTAVVCYSMSISGAGQIAADESLFTDGCYIKTLVDAKSAVTKADTVTLDQTMKTGFVGALSKTDTTIDLRAQNKEVISINLAGGKSSADTSEAANLVTDANTYYGLAPVPGDKWNNISGRWQLDSGTKTVTLNSAIAYDGATTAQRNTMSLSAAAKNTWNADTISNPFLRGYLDDGGGVTVNVTGIPYTTYDVIVYVTSDDARYALAPITVNGTKYTYKNGEVAIDTGTTDWGVGLQATPAFGKNAMIIRNQSRQDLTIYSTRHSGAGRGTLCAVQVINMGGEVLTQRTYETTIEMSTTEATLEQLSYTGSGSTLVSGELTQVTLNVSGTASDAELVLTIDPATKTEFLKIVGARPVKIVASGDLTNASLIDLSETTGNVTLAQSAKKVTVGEHARLILADGVTVDTLTNNGGTIRFETNLSSGTSPNKGAGVYEYKNATINEFVKGTAKIHALSGDTLAITARTGASLEIEDGASVTIGTETESLWYGDDTTYVQKGGTVTSPLNGTGTSGTGYGLLLGYQYGGITEMSISGGEFSIAGSSLNFHLCPTMTVSGTGHVKAKGVIQSGSAGTVTVSESGIFEIGSLGWSSVGLTMNGGTLKAFENSTISSAITISGATTIEVPEGVTLTISGAITGSSNITKTGAGTLVISGSLEGYTGMITATAGHISASDYTKVATSDTGKVIVVETIPEYAAGHFTVPTELESVDFDVLRPTGAIATKAEVVADKTAKISGIVTSFDVTYTNVNAFAYRYKSTGNCRSDNNNNPGYNNDLHDKSTGALLSGHPWIQDIDQTFFTNTKQLTLATAGVMPSADNTTFTHMGNSNGSNYGLYLATGSSADEVIVGYNVGGETNTITSITVPHARTHRHTYVITKDDDVVSNPTKTTFVIYLDGLKWKTFVRTPRFEITGGFQSGSDFGGVLSSGSNPKLKNVTNTDTTSYVNYLRVYDRVISEAEIAKYAEEYPYSSPDGTYERSVAENGNWVSTDAWTSEETTVEKPSVKGNVVVTGTHAEGAEATEKTITVNLTDEVKYEKLTLSGDPMRFVNAGNGARPVKSVCTVVGTTVTLSQNAIDLKAGPTIILDTGKLVFDFSSLTEQIVVANPIDQQVTGEIEEDENIGTENAKIVVVGPKNPGRLDIRLSYIDNSYHVIATVKPVYLKYENSAYSYVLEDGTAVETFLDGDSIAIEAGENKYKGDIWHVGEYATMPDMTDYTVKLNSGMNFKHAFVDNQKYEIASGVSAYLYGDIGSNVTVGGEGTLFPGYKTDGATIAGGTVISCPVEISAHELSKGIVINGAVTMTNSVTFAANSTAIIKLGTAAATLTVKTALPDGKIASGIDSMQLKKVTNEGETTTYTYSLYTPAAKIVDGDETTYFETLQDALDAAEEEVGEVTVTLTTAHNGDVEIPENVILETSSANTLTGAVTGSGTIVFTTMPTSDTLTANAFTSDSWTGTVWLKGIKANNYETNKNQAVIATGLMAKLGHAGTTVKMSDCAGYIVDNVSFSYDLELSNEDATYGWENLSGWGDRSHQFGALKGDGDLVFSAYNTQRCKEIEIFTSATNFRGSINVGNESAGVNYNGKRVVIGTANENRGADPGEILIRSDASVTIDEDKTWTAVNLKVNGTIAGSGTVKANLTINSGATIDLADGALTLAENMTLSLPANVKVKGGEIGELFLKTSADPNVTGSVDILNEDGELTGVGIVSYDSEKGGLVIAESTDVLTINTDTSIETISASGKSQLFVSASCTITGSGELTIGSIACADDATLTISSGVTLKFTDGTVQLPEGVALEAGAKISGTAVPSLAGKTITIADAANLQPGAYPVLEWTAKMTSTQAGYGKPNLALQGETSYTTRLVCLVGKVYLQVIDETALAAKKQFKIWAVGDSITEGYNSSGNSANYRTQLAAKLSLAGYNVKMVGYYNHRNKMPSGEVAPEEWSYHSGVSGQRIWSRSVTGGTSTHAGYIDAIDAAMFQVGKDVDVITVLLGTNDLGNGSDTAQHTFDGWKTIIKKLLEGCPNAEIVVSPLIDMHTGSGSNKRDAYNDLITKGITEENFGAAYTRIHNANLQNYVIGDTTNSMFCDVYHPTWDGHNAMSTGWFDTIKTIIDKDTPAVTPTPKPAAALGAANNAADYAQGFKLARKLAIPETVAYALNAEPEYTEKTDYNNATRIGYYMELVREDASDIRYVWVDMDIPDGKTFSDMLVPTGANLQGVVNNIHVKSNMGSVTEVPVSEQGVNGFLEFSPYNYTSAVSGVTGAPARTWGNFNWNDHLETSGSGRGTMQIHRIFSTSATSTDAHGGQVLFAWNNWGAANTVEGQLYGEIGIGNFAQHYMADQSTGGVGQQLGMNMNNHISLDYTNLRYSPYGDCMNASAYTVRNLEIWAYDPELAPTAVVNGTECATLAAAIDAANDGDTIVLFKDVTAETIALTKDIKIDTLNNTDKTIAATFTGAHKLTKVGEGTLKLTGSNAFNAYDIQGGAVEMTSASAIAANATLTGSGRVIFNGFLPVDNNGKNPTITIANTWTGTVEMKNYDHSSKNAGIIYFGKFANNKSTVSLNGVTATMYTGNNGHDDQVLGALEIGENGWTTTTGNYTIDPKYSCNLTGFGTINIKQGSTGTVNFIGDHSKFAGSITITAGNKAVVLSPVGAAKVTGKTNQSITIAENAVVGASGTWTASAGVVVNGTLILEPNATVPAITGSGRVVFNGWAPTADATTNHYPALFTNANWTGTVELRDVYQEAFAYKLPNLVNSGSKLCFNGYTNYPSAPNGNVSLVGNDSNVHILEIGENGVVMNGTFANFGFNYVADLIGSGKITMTTNGAGNDRNYVHFKGNPSAFTGSIDTTSSTYRLILSSASYVVPTWEQSSLSPMIHVADVTATIGEGETWTAKTIRVDGTVQGAGTINGNLILGSADASVTVKEVIGTVESGVDGYRVFCDENDDGTVTYTIAIAQASVTVYASQDDVVGTKTYYKTLVEAIAAVSEDSDCTVKLESDLAVSETVIVNKTIGLLLNGHTASSANAAVPVLTVARGKTLAIGTTNGGSISNTADGGIAIMDQGLLQLVAARLVTGKIVLDWDPTLPTNQQPMASTWSLTDVTAAPLTKSVGDVVYRAVLTSQELDAYTGIGHMITSIEPVTPTKPTDEPVVVTDPEEKVAMEPGADVTVPPTMPVENIKVVYGGVDLAKAVTDGESQHPKYVNVAINETTGEVELTTTEAAKPAATAIAMSTPTDTTGETPVDEVAFTITDPIPGLFYAVSSCDTPDGDFTSATGDQATSSAAKTVSIPMTFTDGKKVKYYKVSVKATR